MLEAEDLASFVSLYGNQQHEPSDKATEHALRIRGKGPNCCERDSESGARFSTYISVASPFVRIQTTVHQNADNNGCFIAIAFDLIVVMCSKSRFRDASDPFCQVHFV
jgi:hypothetical protein